MKRVQTEDGQDVTEAVQTLYDIAHSSLDWGSGFLDNDEMETVIGLAVLMDWEVPGLPGNSPALQTVARKFPDHYEVTTSPSGYRSVSVRPTPTNPTTT